ncbi:pyridoxal-phosphate-dependent aminotransferase family protein [Pseudonocardia xinjiangensis]|uniref:Alanine--glyoxylate aminotransferase family protein n=1 Tax=Pseudonocardia xinjiangensis TaxID=75289 RepID=A0ABX1R7H7_9PSEU|nr:alanine--glyoxylate aminotransferase family protein [Pseudonocardia xinjiangensis]NMH76337.1 alanine--glyoxylate aminotransferase family protein [Pseudonocardia xinjiangensis]
MHGDRLLLGPGPSTPYPEAVEALARPVLGHLDPEYLALIHETGDRLRQVFRTENPLTLPVSGTGSAGMEACLASLLEPGETVIVGVNGYFGERLCEVAHRGGARVVRVEAPWGTALDPADVLAAHRAHPQAALVAVVAAETSTGVRNDVAPLGPELAQTDTLLLVDAVTALGGTPLEVDAWQIDACYSASQKCLGAPPGLAPVTLGPRAVAKMRNRTTPIHSFYLDLGLLHDYFLASPPRYHHTASSTLAYALHAGLGRLLEEGVESVWDRHARVGALLQSELPELGFSLVAPDGSRLPQLTTAVLPDGLEDGPARTRLLAEYGIEVGGGLGDLAGRAWRIGLMGHAATERSVVTLLGATRELLKA